MFQSIDHHWAIFTNLSQAYPYIYFSLIFDAMFQLIDHHWAIFTNVSIRCLQCTEHSLT